MISRANVSKRGSTWTYFVYTTGGDGRRRRVSTRRFPTRRGHAVRVKAPALDNAGSSPKAESGRSSRDARRRARRSPARGRQPRSVIQLNVRPPSCI